MPAQIVTTSSSPDNGEINITDLSRIIDDYRDLVVIKSETSRQIAKVSTISIPKQVLSSFIEDANDDEYINVRFGVTLPNQKSCENSTVDISNQLTVVLLLANNQKEDKNGPGDYVIAAGFKNNSVKTLQVFCCGDPSTT